jgi:hypothetical protein
MHLKGTAREGTARACLIVALIASAACFVSICLYLSAHRMMWGDEFDAWNLIADPSWRHAFASLNNGADSGPPLFYAIGRCLVAIAGHHPVVVRLYSAFCFWLAAVVWAQILKRHFNTLIGVSAVVLAFLCNFDVVDQMAQVRFYGELVLATALAVRIVLWLEEKQPAVATWFLGSALAGLLLVASHPLALIYSAAILCALMLTRSPLRNRLAALAGTLLSWSYLGIFFLPVKHAAETDTWLGMPHASDVVHFYDNHPLLLVHFPHLSVCLNLILLALAIYACTWFVRSHRWKSASPDSFALLFRISVALALMPIGFEVLSHIYKPIFLGRYLLPSGLGLITLAANGAWLLTQRSGIKRPARYIPSVAVPVAILVLLTVREQALYLPENLEPLLRLAQSTPVVLESGNEVPQARFYFPSRSANLVLVLPTLKPGQHTTLHSIMQQGYQPEVVLNQPFLEQHREFLYVNTKPASQVFEDFLQYPHWKSSDAGNVVIGGVNLPVIRYTRTD